MRLLPLLQVDDRVLQALLREDPELDELLAEGDDDEDLQLPAELQGSEEDDLKVLMHDQDELRKILDQVRGGVGWGCWAVHVLLFCAQGYGRGCQHGCESSSSSGHACGFCHSAESGSSETCSFVAYGEATDAHSASDEHHCALCMTTCSARTLTAPASSTHTWASAAGR